jgi:hypothetical protein
MVGGYTMEQGILIFFPHAVVEWAVCGFFNTDLDPSEGLVTMPDVPVRRLLLDRHPGT